MSALFANGNDKWVGPGFILLKSDMNVVNAKSFLPCGGIWNCFLKTSIPKAGCKCRSMNTGYLYVMEKILIIPRK